MNLVKTSFFTSIGVGFQVISAFVISKVVSVYIGPSGLALIGQFQNFSAILQTFATGATSQGIVKYISEYRDDEEQKRKVLSTALFIHTFCSLLIGLFLFLFRKTLASKLLMSTSFANIFTLFAFTIILFAFNLFLLSVLNGERDIKKYTVVIVSINIFNLIFTSVLAIYYGLFGALTALVLNQSVVFFITLALVIKSHWFKLRNFFNGIDKHYLIMLFKYSSMAITTALTWPVAQLIVRKYIGQYLSWDDAGFWQAIIKISDVYLMLITTTLSVYYLPKLAELKNKISIKKEIIYGYKIILPAVAILAFSIFLFRNAIMHILFTPKFAPMLPLFKFQLLGDVLKVGACLVSYVAIAKTMTRVYVTMEIVFNLSYVIFAIIGLRFFGLQGVTMAFAINYLLYWISMAIIIFNYLKKPVME
jgi:PST family polysaccharide transporter